MNYVEEIADRIRRNLAPEIVPENSYPLLLIYAVLARAKAADTTLEDIHDAWTAWMSMQGKRHESSVPFAELPDAVKCEDEPFLRAILAAL
ncbi:DUF7701 domain-containing protein [Mycobacterium spongiae]|uniref:DUF7701 domain-containing protein n=1 Tax=Mycobacterium spongiae TaxID=886343 RepID=A0A975PVL4_9MYCO|nr:hypothetical protein [Mycobacterium spongiae]QUR66132.1 hypothetical protein F6B93_02680 [Mycobacterium spongiae]